MIARLPKKWETKQDTLLGVLNRLFSIIFTFRLLEWGLKYGFYK